MVLLLLSDYNKELKDQGPNIVIKIIQRLGLSDRDFSTSELKMVSWN